MRGIAGLEVPAHTAVGYGVACDLWDVFNSRRAGSLHVIVHPIGEVGTSSFRVCAQEMSFWRVPTLLTGRTNGTGKQCACFSSCRGINGAALAAAAALIDHTFDVSIKGVTGLPSAAQLLDLGLHAPAQRYLRYQFPGVDVLRSLCCIAVEVQCSCRCDYNWFDGVVSERSDKGQSAQIADRHSV